MVFLAEGKAAFWPWSWVAKSPAAALHDDRSPKDKHMESSLKKALDFGEEVGCVADIWDIMEKGMARELVSDFTQPLPQSERLWRFRVERSDDRMKYRLYCDANDEFLMFAQVSVANSRVEFFLYDPDDSELGASLFDPERPAFTMSSNPQHGEWCLMQERCDSCRLSPKHLQCSCQARKEAAWVHQYHRHIGSGENHCMSISVSVQPDIDDAESDQEFGEHTLVTRCPVWNDSVSSLVLDFKGRQIQPSAKNFILTFEEAPEIVVCQYAKIGPKSFGLDFAYPLSVFQAFGISLTTILWT